ncbi:MAG: hypothetical protein AABX12_02505 [Nanoarchaeota archaeon]
MNQPLKITLPVMLHVDEEIAAFKQAQERLKVVGDAHGVPIEVGAFLLYLPGRSRTPEAFAKQRENQAKHRLPIRLVETGVQQANSLVYSPNNPTFRPDKLSDLERTLEQVAVLRDLDPTASGSLVVAPHVGLLVVDSLKQGDFRLPSYYSVPDFVARREQLYNTAKDRFAQLHQFGSSRGLQLALENTYSAVFENAGFWEKNPKDSALNFGMNYQAFQDFASLKDISQGNIVLDLNHLTAMQNIPARFKRNADVISPNSLFAVLGISSWDEFTAKAGAIGDYLPYTKAFHFSPTDGLGIRVPKGSHEGARWGDGTGPDLTDVKTYKLCIKTARERGLPAAIEADYAFSPLNFREADDFLAARLQDYKTSQQG